MMVGVRHRLACRWTARRVHRLLDDDPDAQLSLSDLERLMAHLEACGECRSMVQDFRRMAASLTRLSVRRAPDPAAVGRLRTLAVRLASQETP